jgi:putative flippase GtrA
MLTAFRQLDLRQFFSFAMVGVVNTILSLLVIWAALWTNVDPYLANAIGYAVGLVNSFFLNRAVTFRVQQTRPGAALRFIVAFVAAYLCNLAVLAVCLATTSVSPFLLQVPAMACYTVIFFILSKWFVFR